MERRRIARPYALCDQGDKLDNRESAYSARGLQLPNELRFAMRTKLILATLIASICLGQTSAFADETKAVRQSTVINEPIAVVWRAIQRLRTADQEHRKLISYQNNQAVIEERFFGLPIIGDATCIYKESEVPLDTINYCLIRSDRFKVFEGSWKVAAINDKKTSVCLTSSCDPGLRIPFWKEISHAATVRNVKHRLEELDSQAHKLASESASK